MNHLICDATPDGVAVLPLDVSAHTPGSVALAYAVERYGPHPDSDINPRPLPPASIGPGRGGSPGRSRGR